MEVQKNTTRHSTKEKERVFPNVLYNVRISYSNNAINVALVYIEFNFIALANCEEEKNRYQGRILSNELIHRKMHHNI